MVDLFKAFLMVLICFDPSIWKFGHAEGSDKFGNSINVQCSLEKSEITIFVTRQHLPASFNHSSFRLNNHSCTGKLNHTHIILQTGLDKCLTVERNYSGSLIYTNVVHGYLKNTGKPSSSNAAFTFEVNCSRSYNMTRNRTNQQTNIIVKKTAYVKDDALQPLQRLSEVNSTSPTPLSFKIVNTKIFKFGEEVSLTAEVSPYDREFISLNTTLAIDVCRVTPDNDFYSKEGVTLIEDGCVQRPRLCGYLFESQSRSQTISYRMSSSSHRTFYLNCRLVLCPRDDKQSLCRVGCRPGYSRKIERNKNNTMMIHEGPLTFNETTILNVLKSQGQRKAAIISDRPLVVVAVGALLFLLAAVGILIFFCRRRRKPKRRDTLLDNEGRFSVVEESFDQVDDISVFEEISETEEPQLSDETYSCSRLEKGKLFLNMDWTSV